MSNTTESISINGIFSPTVYARATALETRDELLAASNTVKLVKDTESAEQAVDMVRQLKEFADRIELSRKDVKAPIDVVVKQIQDTARLLTQSIDEERRRLELMVGEYTRQQRDMMERQRQEALAEQQRVIEEQNRKLQEAVDAGASEKKLDKLEAKAFDAIAEAKANTAAISVPKIAGVALRGIWEYEVTDFAALYKAHPTAVKMAAKDAIVKALLDNTKGVLPGVTAEFVNRSSIR